MKADMRDFSIDAVARRASASKPTIYRWWKGKAALIMEVYEKEREAALTVPDRGSIEQELIMRMRNLWRLWQGTPLGNALRSIIAEAQADPAALTQLREDFLPKRRAWTYTLFDRAVARGEISAQADIESATTLIYSFNWYHLLTDQLGDEGSNRKICSDDRPWNEIGSKPRQGIRPGKTAGFAGQQKKAAAYPAPHDRRRAIKIHLFATAMRA